MAVIFSVFLLPLLSVMTAWTAATGLKGRKRGSPVLMRWAKLVARVFFWMFALMLSRDHFLRVAAASPAAIGFIELVLGASVALALVWTMVSCEKIRMGPLSIKKKSASRDFFAGIGLGCIIAYTALSSGFLPVLSLFPRSLSLSVFVLVAMWSLVSELWLRGVVVPRFRKFVPRTPLILATAALSLISWTGLALSGPFPFLIVMIPALWLSLSSAMSYRWLGFPGSLGTHTSFLFLLLLPL
jgi:hypothetical protein